MSEHANLEDARHPDAVERFRHAQRRLGHAYIDAFFAVLVTPEEELRELSDFIEPGSTRPIDVALDLGDDDLAVLLADAINFPWWYEAILTHHPSPVAAARLVEHAKTLEPLHNTRRQARALAQAGFHGHAEELLSRLPSLSDIPQDFLHGDKITMVIKHYVDLADIKPGGEKYERRACEFLEEVEDKLHPNLQVNILKALAEKTGKDEFIRALASFNPKSMIEHGERRKHPQLEAVEQALMYRKHALAREIYKEIDPEILSAGEAIEYELWGVFVRYSNMDTEGFNDAIADIIVVHGADFVSSVLAKHGYIATAYKIDRSNTRHYPLENRYAFFQKAAEKHPDGLHVAIDQIPWSIDRDIAICVMAEASIAKSDKDVGMKFLKTLIQTMTNDILRNVTIATLIQSLNRRGLFEASLELIDLASDTYYSDALRNFAEGPTAEKVDEIIASTNMMTNMTFPYWRTITLRDAYGKHVLGIDVPNMEKFLKENPDFERRR